MDRRDFLATGAAAAAGSWLLPNPSTTAAVPSKARSYASPREAIDAPRESLVYVPAVRVGTVVQEPDYLATVDVDPNSPTYSRVIHRLPMPTIGDELHHFGWNACSSCHADHARMRRYLVLPGLISSRVHIIDTADPQAPTMHAVIEPSEIAEKSGLTAPHTVHCLPDGQIMLSMLGDRDGNGPGGFLLLDDEFRIAGRWEKNAQGMHYNYDFWYQPRHNVMVSSEWAAPNTTRPGFKLQDVQAGKYGQRLHFWDWEARTIQKSFDLGESGLIPLEVRFHHNPDSTHGFVAAALSSVIWHWQHTGAGWVIGKVIEVPAVDVQGWPMKVPGLITDILVSLDDRFLYFSNWLHGDVRQYDISDPSRPKLTGQIWCGGVLGKPAAITGRNIVGGPQMLQLSLDGKRLYVTNSLFSSWDNQFYPAIGEKGSYLVQIDCDVADGGMQVNESFFVDFGQEPGGPARAHEMRFPGGDCTSDIWV